MMNKLVSLDQAASLVKPGDTLALGGLTLYRRPMAFVRAILQRYMDQSEPDGLTLLAFTAGLESDMLVGAGMVSRTRTCYFGLEIFGLAPMFTYYANRGEIEIVEESEASLAFGLRAQMAGVGFMPGRGWLGTDLPKLRPDVRTVTDPYSGEELMAFPDVRTVTDPYSGEELMAFPAIQADVAVIHALRADPHGNAQIGENMGIDLELSQTARKVIVTAEEIVPELAKADLVAPFVHYVAHAPYGASPSSCHPLYAMDGQAILSYVEQASDPESFHRYLENWLVG